MPKGAGLFKGLALTLRHFFSRSVTVQYPWEKIPIPAVSLGTVGLVINPKTLEDRCSSCRQCERNCPNQAIDLEIVTVEETGSDGKPKKRRVLKSFRLDMGLCMFCGLCIENCPENALINLPDYEFASYTKNDLVFDRERMVGYSLPRMREFWKEEEKVVMPEAKKGEEKESEE